MGPPGFSGGDQWTSTLSPDTLSTLSMEGLDGTSEMGRKMNKPQCIHFETLIINIILIFYVHPNGSV